jgi:hypothetical protein
MPQPGKTFTIGLTMAGAVSAGAYTAGVLDFLFAALAAQDKRDPQENDLRVVLKAMSGTSAGGVCTALAVPALIQGVRTFHPDKPSLPILHRLWVEELDFIGDDARPGLVSDSDLSGPHLLSVLNGEAIEAAAGRVLTDITWTGSTCPFLARDLDLFVTCTNVSGVAYCIPFDSRRPNVGHLMANHAFVGHYRLTGLGTADIPSPWLDIWRDAGVPLELPQPPAKIDFHAGGTGWDSLRRMSIATGAFPFGLAAKPVGATGSHLGILDPAAGAMSCGGAWPLEISPDARPLPLRHSCSASFGFVGVDGGMCNNEPFEIVRYCLRAKDPEHPWKLLQNPREPDRATRAVIMIDPFPEGPDGAISQTVEDADLAMMKVLAALKATLLNQARFKPEELVAAIDDTGRSRFLISPSRDGKHGAKALASGFLGGFGGFLDQSLRAHDFALGRHNAQSFLKKHFNLAQVHDDFGELPGGRKVNGVMESPILRLPDSLAVDIPQPEWPRLDVARIQDLIEATRHRVAKVSARGLREVLRGRLWQSVSWAFWTAGGRAKFTRWLERTIISELIARDQVRELSSAAPRDSRAWAEAETRRSVLAALMAPGPDLRTVEGLAAQTGLSTADVRQALQRKPEHPLFEIWQGAKHEGHATFCLRRYSPRVTGQLPGLRHLHAWAVGGVTYDVAPSG